VHFRANYCHILVIKQAIDFVLNAINFVVEMFDNQVDSTRRFYAARAGHIHTAVNI